MTMLHYKFGYALEFCEMKGLQSPFEISPFEIKVLHTLFF